MLLQNSWFTGSFNLLVAARSQPCIHLHRQKELGSTLQQSSALQLLSMHHHKMNGATLRGMLIPGGTLTYCTRAWAMETFPQTPGVWGPWGSGTRMKVFPTPRYMRFVGLSVPQNGAVDIGWLSNRDEWFWMILHSFSHGSFQAETSSCCSLGVYLLFSTVFGDFSCHHYLGIAPVYCGWWCLLPSCLGAPVRSTGASSTLT